MNSICFVCGKPKNSPLFKCSLCGARPVSQKDKELSIVFSLECIGQAQLQRTMKFVQSKKRRPGIGPAVIKKARQILKDHLVAVESSSSLDFSSSFFDFADDGPEEPLARKIKVHMIGKHKDATAKTHRGGAGRGTCRSEEWEIGKDVSDAEVIKSVDQTTGCLYIWFRWAAGNWTRRFVSRQQFEQLRSVEEGRFG